MSEKNDGALRDVLLGLTSKVWEGLQPDRESSAVMQKHLLLAQAEVLKGFTKVVELQLEKLDKKPEKSAPRTKISVK